MIDYRARILEIATAEIGPQSKGSAKVEAYWRDVLPPEWTDARVHEYAKTKEWCGCFALWCLRQAGLAKDIHWHDGLGFLGPAKLHTTRTPSRGDIGYVSSPFQHHFVFDRIDGDGWVHSVDGNQPDVREKRRVGRFQQVPYRIEVGMGWRDPAREAGRGDPDRAHAGRTGREEPGHRPAQHDRELRNEGCLVRSFDRGKDER